jgi:hypothetical protein
VSRLIITPDDHTYREDIYTFLSYDLEKKSLLHKHQKENDLDCIELDGQGRSTFRPFGITYDGRFLTIASNNRIAYFHLVDYDYCGRVNVPAFLNTHQIMSSGNQLYVTNTSNDSIGIYDLHTGKNLFLDLKTYQVKESMLTPSDVYSDDTVHVNALYEYEGKIYFCLHNHGKKKSEYGFFDKITFETKIIAEAGYKSHNVVILDNHLYSLSSGTGEIVRIDLNTNQPVYMQYVDPDITFLRGLDIYQNKLLIGCSNNHKSERMMYKDNCYIALFDTKEVQVERYMEIDDAYIITDLKVI